MMGMMGMMRGMRGMRGMGGMGGMGMMGLGANREIGDPGLTADGAWAGLVWKERAGAGARVMTWQRRLPRMDRGWRAMGWRVRFSGDGAREDMFFPCSLSPLFIQRFRSTTKS